MERKIVQVSKKIVRLVKLEVPPMEPHHEFLSKRVNTEIYFCGDIESIKIEEGSAKMTMALGNLTLSVDKDVKEHFPFPLETLLNKNVCVNGYLTASKEGFEMCIKDSKQTWLSGH